MPQQKIAKPMGPKATRVARRWIANLFGTEDEILDELFHKKADLECKRALVDLIETQLRADGLRAEFIDDTPHGAAFNRLKQFCSAFDAADREDEAEAREKYEERQQARQAG